ncbi:hypothetical protein BCV70DRAFT_202473 [Testicularia cyperi]|uniref:Matrin-type domain-containing protein n=1 Tax=Testicularia cyperi TaxID=1882483 RepID=A0A317XIA5_9BASI|nr:hypothetical protein BCV70DRAFT_202473 [Testicularia cyperi]
MADTSLFEVARQTHEEAERYQQALVDILVSSSSNNATTHKDKLKRAHKASNLLDRIASRYQYLDDFYTDARGERAQELESLATQHPPAASTSITDDAKADDNQIAFGEFYARLGRIREYHEKYPGAVPDVFSVDFTALESRSGGGGGATSGPAPTDGYVDAAGLDFIDRMFSGEETAGRFLDLYVHHEAFLNLRGVKRSSYLQYIDDFDKLSGPSSKIPNDTKRSEAYKTYLFELRRYLSSFLRKTQPLANVDDVEQRALDDFDNRWQQGQVAGWEEKGEEISSSLGKSKAIHPAPGGNGAAQDQGIWCEACRRYYSKQTVYDAHLKSPKHLKAAARLAQAQNPDTEAGARAHEAHTVKSNNNGSTGNEAERVKHQIRAKAIARDELIIVALAREMASLRADTKSNVERRAALTDRERQAEAEAAEEELNRMSALGPTAGLDGDDRMDEDGGLGDDNDDGMGKVYNPLKLPLGWDGRPIPFWLYKLHGLGQDFKCEICSDFVYSGRKNFEKHFQESRHAFGMRALGLPNTVQFRDVTRIADALALADKLRKQGKLQNENPNDMEEVEDDHGNTYTKKTYELLKRQGLI